MNDLKPRYKGEIHNCVRHGNGTYDYPGGVYSYDGSWENGNKHGSKEKFIIHGYSTYIGDMVNGEINGKGIRRWDDGRTYDGDWHFGEMHGRGKWTDRTGSEIYDGQFSSNKRHGEGKLQMGNQDVYEGTFVSHKFDGSGRYYRKNIFSIEGPFQQGTLQGFCNVIWNHIATFHGQWTRGVPHGYGFFQASDNSLQFAGRFIKGIPIGISEVIKVDIDRSATFADSPLDKKDKKDKKENKEVKKKNPANKKTKEIVPDLTVASGSRLGKFIVLTTTKILSQNSVPIVPSVSKVSTAAAPHKGGKKGIHASITSIESPTLPAVPTVPTPSELTRKLIFRIRPLSIIEGSTPGMEDEMVLGEAIPLWRKYPSLRSAATAWDRFPISSTRFIDGKNITTGTELVIENKTTALSPSYDHDNLQALKLTDGITALHTIASGELRGSGEALTVLIDFRLDAATIADNATSVSRFCVRDQGMLLPLPVNKMGSEQSPLPPHSLEDPGGDGGAQSDRDLAELNNKDTMQPASLPKPDFTVIPLFSLGRRFGELDGSSRLELVLQVPTVILEETAEWDDMQRVSRSRAASVTESQDDASHVSDSAPRSPPPLDKLSPLYNEAMSDERLWTSCCLELRLSNTMSAGVIDKDRLETTSNTNRDDVTYMPGEEGQAEEDASEKKMITEFTSLSKWAVDSIKANSWHSLAVTLSTLPVTAGQRLAGGEAEGVDLILNGSRLLKGGEDDKVGIAQAWLPEKSFFLSDHLEPAKTEAAPAPGGAVSNSSLDGIRNSGSKSENAQASVVVRIGGSGFDGYLKTLAIFTENDLFDAKRGTAVFPTWLQGYKGIESMLASDYRLREEARIEKEKQLAAELERKTNELAQAGKTPPPAVQVAVDKSVKKKKAVTAGSPGSPSSSTPELTLPRDCIECTDIVFYCKGGRGEVDRVIIPPATVEGLFAVEIADAVSSQCLSKASKEIEGEKRPAEVVDMHFLFPALDPDQSFKLQIVNEL